MGLKERIKKLKSDFAQRTLFFTVLSQLINLAFAVYNTYLGIKFHDEFAIGISIYYLLLFWVILATLIVEKRVSGRDDATKSRVRAKNYIATSILIFVIDLCLIAPIIIMAVRPKDVNFGLIPAIVMATYCVYKITTAVLGYKKSTKTDNLSLILFKEIKIIGAIVSILMLQHTLIMVNGGMNQSMQNLSLATSIAFIVFLVIFSVLSFLKNRKLIEKSN